MKVVYMNGGLGNQLFQYIFLRWLEEKYKEEVFIDDSAFFFTPVPHNGYEIERIFGVKKRRLSEYFSEDQWVSMLEQKSKQSIVSQLTDSGFSFSVMHETDAPEIDFNGKIISGNSDLVLDMNMAGNWYYYGYWMGDLFFQEIEEVLRKELAFPKVTDLKNRIYESQIQNTESVAIHIRRGDMVSLGWTAKKDYFSEAIRYIESQKKAAHYFVFSDDLKWCHNEMEQLGLNRVSNRVTFVDGNAGQNAYKDLQLMSLCQHTVASRSSFSLLAGYLNQNKEKIFTMPMPDQIGR